MLIVLSTWGAHTVDDTDHIAACQKRSIEASLRSEPCAFPRERRRHESVHAIGSLSPGAGALPSQMQALPLPVDLTAFRRLGRASARFISLYRRRADVREHLN